MTYQEESLPNGAAQSDSIHSDADQPIFSGLMVAEIKSQIEAAVENRDTDKLRTFKEMFERYRKLEDSQ